ncbi:MAG TPA: OmpA family protein [Rhizobacter sp.]|nr:OmpA family protein [Rhizobacter sp.]
MNPTLIHSRRGLIALLVAVLCAGAWAQEAEGPVLKGNKVTESNLLDALTPPPEPVVTRSLKVTRDNSAGVLAPKKRASASLLITFETNSSDLTDNAKKQLDVVAAALKNDRLADYNFSVEGHADPRGNAEANMLLSQQRAESVRAYLVSAHQIAAERLKAEGRGDRDLMNRAFPAAPENRRVTIVTITP